MQPILLGKYQLLKKIAVGGMAEIWVARSSGISGVEQICVVKRILPELSTNADFVRMFLDEARIAATLNHPNLAQMYDVGEVGGRPFIAMEYLHGEDVRSIRKALRPRRGRMPVEHALNVIMGVAAGLHYAHEKVGFDGRKLNVVHRDISPHNVFVTHDGAVKILDFGIAVAENRDHATQNGTLKGKIPYMSPEQCLCEPLDRRSDIYSVGVMLHELTTGPRLHKPGASEYEMMRAILEGPVVLPSQIIPDYPKALERIVLRCLERDKEKRYPTARELHADLEAFVREERLAVSSFALSGFMAELFGSRAEAWREALASGRDLLAHIVERQPPATILAEDWAMDEPFDDGGAPPPSRNLNVATVASDRRAYGATLDVRSRAALPREVAKTPSAPAVAAPEAETSNATRIFGDMSASKRRVGDVLALTLTGKLNEGFQGKVLAQELSGRVILDLAGVTRVTSFGVREWLQMLTEAAPRVSELYFFRCAEPIVNQMSMIRGFSGEGRVVSFYAPYRCDTCGAGFTRLFDVEADAGAVQSSTPPAERCPRCGGEGSFDDDPVSYLAFVAGRAGEPVDATIRAAHEQLVKAESGFGEAIEKAVDAGGTRVTVRCPLDGSVRWKRILDGIEGALVFDLGAAGGVSPEGAAGFERALRGLGGDVASIRIEGCPSALLAHLAASGPGLRAEITSAMIEARCEACSAPRAALVSRGESAAAQRRGGEPRALCPRCGAALSFAGAEALLRQLEGDAGDVTPRSEPAAAPPLDAAPPASVAASPRRFPWAILVAVVAVGVAIFLGVTRGRAPIDPPAPAGAPMSAPTAASAPSWTGQDLLIEGGDIFAVGRGSGAMEDEALAAARDVAIDRLALAVLNELSGTELHRFVTARLGGVVAGERRPEVLAAEAARYLRQVGSFATPERIDARVERGAGQVTVLGRYRLRQRDFAAAVASYRRTGLALGLTVARVFPLLDRARISDLDLVVIAVDPKGRAGAAGVRPGDLVVSVNARLTPALDAFAAAVTAAADRPLDLLIESEGARRSVKIAKP